MTELQKAMRWLLSGSTGMSSECMMATILNGSPIKCGNWKDSFHPHDPSDLLRCIGLLNSVPSFRAKLDLMKAVSSKWAILIDHWDELESLLNSELKQRSAPKTYARMKELFKLTEVAA